MDKFEEELLADFGISPIKSLALEKESNDKYRIAVTEIPLSPDSTTSTIATSTPAQNSPQRRHPFELVIEPPKQNEDPGILEEKLQKTSSTDDDDEDVAEESTLLDTTISPCPQLNKPIKLTTLRIAELTTLNLDCALSEACLKRRLLSLAGAIAVQTDVVHRRVFVVYDRARSNTPAILDAVASAGFPSTHLALQLYRSNAARCTSLSQISFVTPTLSRLGWDTIANHLLALDGVVAAVPATDGSDVMSVHYTALVVSPRRIARHLSALGDTNFAVFPNRCNAIADLNSRTFSEGRKSVAIGIAIVLISLGIIALDPNTFLLRQVKNMPLLFWAHAALAMICICESLTRHSGLHELLRSSIETGCFTSHAAIVLSQTFLLSSIFFLVLANPNGFSACCMGFLQTLLSGGLASVQRDVVHLAVFDQICWLMVIWRLGLSISRKLKSCIANPITRMALNCAPPISPVRVVAGNGSALLGCSDKFIEPGTVQKVVPDLVEVGDVLYLRPGERIWTDGIVMSSGPSTIQEVALTSASGLPEVNVINRGDVVKAGSLFMNGEDLQIKVTAPGPSSLLARLLVTARRGSLRTLGQQRWLQRHAVLYGVIFFVMGLILAVWEIWKCHQFYHRSGGAVTPLKYFIAVAMCEAALVASSTWLSSMSFSQNVASAAVGSALAAATAKNGVILNSYEAYRRLSATSDIVVSRHLLRAVGSGSSVSAVVLCHKTLAALIERKPALQPSIAKTKFPIVAELTVDFAKNEIVPMNDTKLLQVFWSAMISVQSAILARSTDSANSASNAVCTYQSKPQLHGKHSAHAVALEFASWKRIARTIVSTGTEFAASPPVIAALAKSLRIAKGCSGAITKLMDETVLTIGSVEFFKEWRDSVKQHDSAANAEWKVLETWAFERLQQGHEVVLLGVDSVVIGALLVTEMLPEKSKAFSHAVVKHWEEEFKVRTWIITGASIHSAPHIARQTGVPVERIRCCTAQCDKRRIVRQIESQSSGTVCFVARNAFLLAPFARINRYVTILVDAPSGQFPLPHIFVPRIRAKNGKLVSDAVALNVTSLFTLAMGANSLGVLVNFISLWCPAASLLILTIFRGPLIRLGPMLSLGMAFAVEYIILCLSACLLVSPTSTVSGSVVQLSPRVPLRQLVFLGIKLSLRRAWNQVVCFRRKKQ